MLCFLLFLTAYTASDKCILYNLIYSHRFLNKIIPFKFCSYMSMRFGNQFLLKIPSDMYHTKAHHGTFQALIYIFSKAYKHIWHAFLSETWKLNIPPKTSLSKLSRKWFGDPGQATPFMDLPKKTVSIISAKKYF